jgi:hypothetical protein
MVPEFDPTFVGEVGDPALMPVGKVAVEIPVKVAIPLPVPEITPVEATPTGFVVNDRIGPLRSRVVCFPLILV